QANTSEGAMYAFQGVANLVPMDGVFVNVGAADFLVKRAGAIARARTTNDQLSITNTVALSDGSRIGGRRIDPTKLGTDADDNPITVLGFVSDFNLVNVNGDVSIATGKPRWPLQAWADYVNNTDANVSEDTGYQIGAGIGGKKDPGDVNFSYAWQHLETDAVVSAFSDSDYARDGGTNGEGHILQLNYVPLKNLTLTSTAWIVDPIVDVEGRSKETDYRWQVDLIAKF
ncbi:MAG: hypothetical protein QOD06_2536, partial [Candidatus Binatota bacterium]|nr:hypothetical protein [Candidatus Binatota bacterium]